jgi:hypothetical protein
MSTDHFQEHSKFDRLPLDGRWHGRGVNSALVLTTVVFLGTLVADVLHKSSREESPPPSVKAPATPKKASLLKDAEENADAPPSEIRIVESLTGE